MERLAEQPAQERLRSFDPLASVDMLRFDLQTYGDILPETWERVQNEELSYLSEGVDRAARTSFALKRDEEGSLVYFDRGQWRPYTAMLNAGREVAKAEAVVDPRKQFLAEWAGNDQIMGYKMRALQPGQTLTWTNAYPHEIAARYGAEFVRQCGLQPDRQMGFIYQAICHYNGTVELLSQTVDQSDPDAFAAVEQAKQYDTELDLDGLTRVYDGALRKKYGQHFYAGRREAEAQENAWLTINRERDLIQYFMQGLLQLAHMDIGRDQLERYAKEHVYGVWATFKERMDGNRLQPTMLTSAVDPYEIQMRLQWEVQQNLQSFAAQGKALVGCGGVIELIQGEKSLLDLDGAEAFSTIFGKESSSGSPEKYAFDKRMFCRECQAPPEDKAKKKWCGPCGICQPCDSRIQAVNAASGIAKLLPFLS